MVTVGPCCESWPIGWMPPHDRFEVRKDIGPLTGQKPHSAVRFRIYFIIRRVKAITSG